MDAAGYYKSNKPLRRVIDFIKERYGEDRAPDVKTLAAIDSFHLRGRAATRSLSASVDLQPGMKILDVGSGPGGTARYLAEQYGVQMVGLDLTLDFSCLATLLSQKVNMTSSTRFICGSALQMPFADKCFDGVWMEHVQMNIADKSRLLSDIARVLKPSGFLAMYEIFRMSDLQPDDPLPWAENNASSFLVPPETMKKQIEAAGFQITRWHDCIDDIRRWLEKRTGSPSPPSPSPISDVRLLMGDRATEKVRNFTAAVMDSRLCVVEAVCRKTLP